MTSKAKATKGKMDKLDFIKSKNLSVSNDTIKEVDRHHAEWEKIFIDHIPDNKLVSSACAHARVCVCVYLYIHIHTLITQ